MEANLYILVVLCIYMYIHIWVNYKRPHCDLTGIMVSKGNHPQMAELFRLVKYFNLPIYIYRYMYYWFCRTPILIASDDIIPKEKKMGRSTRFSVVLPSLGLKLLFFSRKNS